MRRRRARLSGTLGEGACGEILESVTAPTHGLRRGRPTVAVGLLGRRAVAPDTLAFQPILDVARGVIAGYQARVGPLGAAPVRMYP